MPQTVITRFAPSPTGNLHIGGARTALFAWAFARQHQGQLILRMEDTDLARSTPESTRGIIRDLLWLGLPWDQGPAPIDDPNVDPYQTQVGEKGPYFQSQRHELGLYNEQIERLLKSGQAYEDGDAVRFRMDKDITFDDVVYGPNKVTADNLEDFIIRKGEKGGGLPTFHFAVTVDDALMGVTHVIRGQEHLTNTSKHAALCDALGFERPTWVHLPSIMNADGSKMSKRDQSKKARHAALAFIESNPDVGALRLLEMMNLPSPVSLPIERILEYEDPNEKGKTYGDFLAGSSNSHTFTKLIEKALNLHLPEVFVHDFRENGYLPDVILNYIALLGWNPGNDIERFDKDFLIKHFDLKRIGKKNSQFDRIKLAKFNTDTLAEMDAEAFHKLLREFYKEYRPTYLDKFSDNGFRTCAAMYQARSQTLSTPAELGRFFVCADDEITYDEKAVNKNLTKNDGEGLNVLKQFHQALDEHDDWTADALHKLIESFVAEHQLKNMGSVAQPLRVALTGSAVSPEIGPTLELLGKETVLNRIKRCLDVHTTKANEHA